MFYGIVSGFETFSKQDQKNATKTIDNYPNGSDIRKNVYDQWIGYLKQAIEMYDVVKLLQDTDPMITPKTEWKYQGTNKVEDKKDDKKSDKDQKEKPKEEKPAPAPQPAPAPTPAK